MEAAAAKPNILPPAFARRQRVVVLYGRLTNGHAVGGYGVNATVTSLKHRRRGWYGLTLGNGATLSAHVSAMRVN